MSGTLDKFATLAQRRLAILAKHAALNREAAQLWKMLAPIETEMYRIGVELEGVGIMPNVTIEGITCAIGKEQTDYRAVKDADVDAIVEAVEAAGETVKSSTTVPWASLQAACRRLAAAAEEANIEPPEIPGVEAKTYRPILPRSLK